MRKLLTLTDKMEINARARRILIWVVSDIGEVGVSDYYTQQHEREE